MSALPKRPQPTRVRHPLRLRTRLFLLLLAPLFCVARSDAQIFSFEGGIIAGGGGASSNAQYSVAGILGEPSAGKSSGAAFTVEGGTVSLETFVSGPVIPPLTVNRSAQTIEISWVSPAGLVVLQETPNLDGTSWSDASATPTQVNGRWVVTFGTSTGMRFYRLTSAAPVLVTQRKGATLEVSWTSADRSFVLQESSNLAGVATWSDVPTTPFLIAGRWVVALPIQSNPRFLRLRRP